MDRTTTIIERAKVSRAVRAFFHAHDFVEVDTPVAITAPAPEPHIEAPAVTLRLDTESTQRYLQPSPELPMKRLLALGLPRIFQLAAVFRDGELGPLHRPEFRLLEWYRRDASWTALMEDCELLLTATAEALGHGDTLPYRGESISLQRPFRRISMDAAFRQHAGFSILDHLDCDSLGAQLKALGIPFSAQDSWNDLFHRVFLDRVEPALLADRQPLFLTHYPAPLSALARLSPEDARTAERFELYVGGIELANGFGELVDAQEQRHRFEIDRGERIDKGMHDYPLDERFFAALSALPPSAGIALGFERLLMLLLNAADIDDVACLPWSET